MLKEDWSKHIKIDRNAILEQLDEHYVTIDEKLVVRFYTLKPSGTQLLVDGLCVVLHDALPYYVYGEADIKKIGLMKAGLNAHQNFGLRDPHTDGKYGELLLFVLVESVLGCKMIAHKIQSLTNTNDQIKGGDGIFIGDYEYMGTKYPSYLIGESKVTGSLSLALKEAFVSLERFHDEKDSIGFLGNELIVAQQFLRIEDVDLEELYNRLTPSTAEFKLQNLVHPVLLMYPTTSFQKCETSALDAEGLRTAIIAKLKGKEEKLMNTIKEKLVEFPRFKTVYLDFFIIPCNSVKAFREYMFKQIHAVPYQRFTKDEK
jgi:hypothetical protein